MKKYVCAKCKLNLTKNCENDKYCLRGKWTPYLASHQNGENVCLCPVHINYERVPPDYYFSATAYPQHQYSIIQVFKGWGVCAFVRACVVLNFSMGVTDDCGLLLLHCEWSNGSSKAKHVTELNIVQKTTCPD